MAAGYEGLKVWQYGMTFVEAVYAVSRAMPKTEQYGMTSQMLRSAVSVPANIAEGYQRGTRKDYAHFISIARGSLAETETYLKLAARIGLLEQQAVTPPLTQAADLGRMLTRLRVALLARPGA